MKERKRPLVIELPFCYFFEVHRSKLKPNPIGHMVQTSVRSITHDVFFLRIGKYLLNCLTAHGVGFLSPEGMPNVFRLLYVMLPNVAGYNLLLTLTLCALADFIALCTVSRIAFVFPVSVSVLLQNGLISYRLGKFSNRSILCRELLPTVEKCGIHSVNPYPMNQRQATFTLISATVCLNERSP